MLGPSEEAEQAQKEAAEKARMESEQKAKADAASGSGSAHTFTTEEAFMQYIRQMEEDRKDREDERRERQEARESQNKLLAEMMNKMEGRARDNQTPTGGGVSLGDFQQAKPLTFASSAEPMDAEDWLLDTESKLETVGCNNQEKLRYAVHQLTGPAAAWWVNYKAVQPAESDHLDHV